MVLLVTIRSLGKLISTLKQADKLCQIIAFDDVHLLQYLVTRTPDLGNFPRVACRFRALSVDEECNNLIGLLLGCHGLPSLKMGLVVFFSSEKLQLLRNIVCIRFNNDPAAV